MPVHVDGLNGKHFILTTR